jgi:8-oxo-dGTP pyrophosphatase MutT (NUDIX family)
VKAKYHNTAGGVVFDDAGRVLTIVRDIDRNGRIVHEVRLPKGHIDPGETAEQAAVREVCEESGYCQLAILADLGTIQSEFDFKDKHNIRDERYFLMQLTVPERQAPQPTGNEEALFQPLWLDPAEAESQLTYESERQFMRRARTARK